MSDSTASADGSLSYTATQTDVAGNTSATSSALSVTLDTTAAAPPDAPDLQPASDSGTSSGDNITRSVSRTLGLSGAEPSATLTLLRDGVTVGIVPMAAGAEDRIVELMLGAPVEAAARGPAEAARRPAEDAPRLRIRNLRVGTKLRDVSFDLLSGEVLGVVALEGQGQDEEDHLHETPP